MKRENRTTLNKFKKELTEYSENILFESLTKKQVEGQIKKLLNPLIVANQIASRPFVKVSKESNGLLTGTICVRFVTEPAKTYMMWDFNIIPIDSVEVKKSCKC